MCEKHYGGSSSKCEWSTVETASDDEFFKAEFNNVTLHAPMIYMIFHMMVTVEDLRKLRIALVYWACLPAH